MRKQLTVTQLKEQLDKRYLAAGKVVAEYFNIDDLNKLKRKLECLSKQAKPQPHDNQNTNEQPQT